MIDTMTVLVYLLTHNPGHSTHLQISALFPKNSCVQKTPSPQLRWKKVPPESTSLALIIKDAPSHKTSTKPHYYWIVYNLSPDLKGLSFGADAKINPYDKGINSWGKNNYHAPCWRNKLHPIEIELVALDKRFSARYKMTGEKLEQKIKSSTLASGTYLKL